MPARSSEEDMGAQSAETTIGGRDSSVLPPRLVIHSHRHNLRHRFELVKTLGEGTYGKVKLAVERSTGEKVAIKYIKKTKIQDEPDLCRIRREIRITSSLNHPHIVNVREVFENKDKIILVMDYATGGELYDYINDKKHLTEKEARRIFRQIVSAIHYCHQNGVVHRDLKLENIVMDECGSVKIADFGLSNFIRKDDLLTTFCGSPLYASPEIVNGMAYHGPEVDCWSLGVILYTLVYGAMPFDGSDFKVLRKQISNGDYYEPARPSEAAGLLRHLMTVNPAKRAKVDDVLNHWWVNLGYKFTPTMESYPNAQVLRPVSQNSQNLSSDSEGEMDSIQRSKPLKGILKKPKTKESSFEEDEAMCDEDSSKSPSHFSACASPLFPEPMQGANLHQGQGGSCNSSDISNSGDENRKVFDSEKQPKRGILKRKGKFSGGDSGVDLVESTSKSPDYESKAPNHDLGYNFCDADSRVGPGGSNSLKSGDSEVFTSNMELNTTCDCDNSAIVPRRRGILKKTSQSQGTDPNKRLSLGSLSSNSSADILDFSYDSGDEAMQTKYFTSQLEIKLETQSRKFENVDNGEKLRTLQLESEKQTTVVMHQNDSGHFSLEEAQQMCKEALEICQRMK